MANNKCKFCDKLTGSHFTCCHKCARIFKGLKKEYEDIELRTLPDHPEPEYNTYTEWKENTGFDEIECWENILGSCDITGEKE